MDSNNQFSKVGGLRPKRNAFDLSYSKLGTCTFGELIPVMCDEVVPGDTWKIGVELIIRFQPMIAPILHEVSATIHYFFVPYRLLTGWSLVNGAKQAVFDWELFISGGYDGTYSIPLPRHNPTAEELRHEMSDLGSLKINQRLWNLFGFPSQSYLTAKTNPDVTPIAFPWWAYALIQFEYYRDKDIYPRDSPEWVRDRTWSRAWKKDYFTSARPWPQRGPVAGFPLRGTNEVQFFDVTGTSLYSNIVATSPGGTQVPISLSTPSSVTMPSRIGRIGIDNSQTVTFNISDLRLITQLQKWAERNARSGVRYTEFLRSHFGVSPSDSRLDRPEYIGGHKSHITVSEVLQTSASQTNAPQANMAGHGLNASNSFVASYPVTEYGLIMGLLSVMPKATYQQGINRQWLRYSKYDFYFPEFAHLSEQGIYRSELYYQNLQAASGSHFAGETVDSQIFGFQGRYDEMRVKHDMVVSEMRDTGGSPDLSFWHLGRFFNTEPVLNNAFVSVFFAQNNFMRAFAVQDRAPIIFHVGNKIKAIRPLPAIAEPGLVDHF